MGDEGLELFSDSSGETASAAKSLAESYAVSTVSDPELAEVVRAWPTLPDAARRGILGIVRASAAKTATKGAKP